LTVRSEALAADPTLREWLAGCGRDAPLQLVAVDALSEDQTHELVLTLAGRTTARTDRAGGVEAAPSCPLGGEQPTVTT
jgi:hypothetical protein